MEEKKKKQIWKKKNLHINSQNKKQLTEFEVQQMRAEIFSMREKEKRKEQQQMNQEVRK